MKYHIIAVSGTATATLASLLKEKGAALSGSDISFYPPMGELVKSLGIKLYEGFSSENIDRSLPLDGVIVGNFVPSSNPEAERAIELGLDLFSVPEALYHFAMKGKERIVVAGTHGKTTTTALLAFLMDRAGLNPGFFVGGLPMDFPSSGRLGGDWFVAEGDEYETSFFDKGPKFFHLFPKYLLLGPVEMDHYDIYENLGELERVFSLLVSMVPSSGLIVSADTEANRKILQGARARVITVPSKEWALEEIREKGEGMVLSFKTPSGKEEFFYPGFSTPLARNFSLALPLLLELGLPLQSIKNSLKDFRGVKRRMELLGENEEAKFFTDFAHHPSSLELNLRDLRKRFEGWKIIALVEPASWTMRSGIFQDRLPGALSAADAIILAPPPSLKIKKGRGLDRKRVVEELGERGKEAFAPEDWEGVYSRLPQLLKGKTVVVFFSNGNIQEKAQRLIGLLFG